LRGRAGGTTAPWNLRGYVRQSVGKSVGILPKLPQTIENVDILADGVSDQHM
jgi:hypothetical protein